jgi:dTDP-4-amino-4,6-dideoxygalactose transaminase
MKTIVTTLSPNTERDDRALAWRVLFRPWLWQKGSAVTKLEQQFALTVGAKHAVSFDSGRSALLAVLQCLGVGKGDEVLVPGFTCVVVPNAVLFDGAKPVYTDVTDDWNVDVKLLEASITPQTKAILVQHTFGRVADIDAIVSLARKHKLFVIEDCAHALGATHNGKQVGSFGDAAIWSFGRDKCISCVHGGMATTSIASLADTLVGFQKNLKLPSIFITKRQLLHPILFGWILPLYRSGFGKALLVFSQKLGVLTKVMTAGEKRGVRPAHHPARLANALALLALHQLEKIDRFTAHRRKIAGMYADTLKGSDYSYPALRSEDTYLMFSVRHPHAEKIRQLCKKSGILLGVWRDSNIVPPDTARNAVGYVPGSCAVAEVLAEETLNLPTHGNVTEGDVRRITEVLLKQ